MSPQAWEDFIFEWAYSLKTKYARVEQCGSSGDMGRDIVAFESTAVDDPWDNYQCKHYDHRLSPADIWTELGKLAHYTFVGEYSLPRRYIFVAPQGPGNALSKLLRRADELREKLFSVWDRCCRTRIASTKQIILDSAMRAHIEKMDFSIFRVASPLTIIEEHRGTPWYVTRFGGGLPPRRDAPLPPATIGSEEANYVRALLDAYEDRLGMTIGSMNELADVDLRSHFSRSRREFYSAESLREFSRDNVPAGTFERLLNEVHDGIIDVVQATHADAYERVLAAVRQAKTLQLTANALIARTTTCDRGGMCHQLANDLRVRWRR
jgi:hypothetical protein